MNETDRDPKLAPDSRFRLPQVDFGSKKWAVFNTVAALVTIGLFVLGPFEEALGKTSSAVLVLVIFAVMLLFVASGIRSSSHAFASRLLGEVTQRQDVALGQLQTEYINAIDARSAEALPLARMQYALPHLRDMSLDLKKIEQAVEDNPAQAHDIALGRLRESLQRTVLIFKQLSSHECRLCIKLEYTPVSQTGRAVYAIARSNTAVPDERMSPDYVTQNTDFNRISVIGESHWFCRDILELEHEPGQYLNSSPDRPYRSVIVWPLRVFDRPKSGLPLKQDGSRILGYLCLDSMIPGAFSEERELQLGWWYVDVLAVVLNALISTGGIEVR